VIAACALAYACLAVQLGPGAVQRVIDGDTFVLYHVGVPPEERVRLLGVDAAELRDSLGTAARTFTETWLSRGPFTLFACRRDSFGRLLAVVTRGADTLAVDLIRAGLGVQR
jgi:endonuclease YncB( thermonuclease family)